MNKPLSEHLVQEINALHENVKAEILVAGLLKAGATDQDIKVEHAGSFTRPYSSDVLSAAVNEWGQGGHSIKLQISRNGIYDLLPEALSHGQQLGQEAGAENNSLAAAYKRRKKEEAEARSFFQPFEQEFFMLGVALEQEEEGLLYNPSSAFYRFLIDFWKISEGLPARYESALLQLLPHLHSFAGDLDAVTHCLELILEQPVYYQLSYRSEALLADFNKLGKGKLGQSFTMGCYVHAVPYVEIIIASVPVTELPYFLPGSAIDEFLKVFLAYALPFELQPEIKVMCQRNATLPEAGAGLGVLGYSAFL